MGLEGFVTLPLPPTSDVLLSMDRHSLLSHLLVQVKLFLDALPPQLKLKAIAGSLIFSSDF